MDESITTERHVAQMSTFVFSLFLLVATIATYIPQYRRIRKRRDATGISTWYLVFTTIATTEQFALLLVLSVMNVPDDYDFPGQGANSLSTVQGWLDLMQMGAVWLLSSGLLLLSIRFPGSSAMTKASAVMAYLAWFSISFGAFIFQIFCQDYYQDPVRQSQLTAAFLDWHFMVLNPCATAAIALSFFAQSHTTLWLRSRGALSIESLATQAVVCAALAASWSKRLAPTEDASEDPHCRFIAWYNTGGWAVFNCLLWSAVQAYLLVLSVFAMCMGPRRRTAEEKKRKRRNKLQKKQQRAKSRKDKKPDETTPLLPLFHSSGDSRLRKKKKDGSGGERRRFRSFLAKFKWRKKQKKRKAASRWRRVLGRESV